MRKKYSELLISKLKNKEYSWPFKQAYNYFAIPLSYIIKKPLSGPLLGGLIVTYRCNSKCFMCDLWKRPYKEELNTDNMFKIIDDFSDLKTTALGITGGEPLLRGDMCEIIKYARKKRILVHLNTNGYLIDKTMAKKLIDSGINAISISLDAANPEIHNKIRGRKDAFKLGIKGMSNLLEARNKDTSLHFTSIISELNFRNILNLVRLTEDLGVDSIGFNTVHTFGLICNKEERCNQLLIKKENLEEADKIIDEIINKKNIENSTAFLKLLKLSFRDKPCPVKCYAGYNSYYVDCFGNIFPCMGWVQMNKPVENIKNISLKEFWSSEKAKKMREEVKKCPPCYMDCSLELNLIHNYRFFTSRI